MKLKWCLEKISTRSIPREVQIVKFADSYLFPVCRKKSVSEKMHFPFDNVYCRRIASIRLKLLQKKALEYATRPFFGNPKRIYSLGDIDKWSLKIKNFKYEYLANQSTYRGFPKFILFDFLYTIWKTLHFHDPSSLSDCITDNFGFIGYCFLTEEAL